MTRPHVQGARRSSPVWGLPPSAPAPGRGAPRHPHPSPWASPAPPAPARPCSCDGGGGGGWRCRGQPVRGFPAGLTSSQAAVRTDVCVSWPQHPGSTGHGRAGALGRRTGVPDGRGSGSGGSVTALPPRVPASSCPPGTSAASFVPRGPLSHLQAPGRGAPRPLPVPPPALTCVRLGLLEADAREEG